MASPGSVFSETLQSITNTKLEQLSKERASFEEQYHSLKTVSQLEQDPLKRLVLLVDGVKSCFSVKTTEPKQNNKLGIERRGRVIIGSTNHLSLEIEVTILGRFLEQAVFDPSISPKILSKWEETLWQYLSIKQVKYEYATLYGQLVTEWLSSEKKPEASLGDEMDLSEPFEEISRAKKLESRAEWERVVFEPGNVDEAALKNYLSGLFGRRSEEDDSIPKSLEVLQKEVKDFEYTLTSHSQFTYGTLSWTIKGLLSSDLLTDEKRAALKDFLQNDTIISEICDVLNMRMDALRDWTWGDGVIAEQRRTIKGTYNIYLHEDLIQAIFLQFIGIKWSVFLKQSLKRFRKRKGVWKPLRTPIPKEDRKRRDYYVGPQTFNQSVQSRRSKIFRHNYFISQLPNVEHQQIEMEDGEEEVEYQGECDLSAGSEQAPGAPPMQLRRGAPMQAPRMSLGRKSAYMSVPSGSSARRMRHYRGSDDERESDEESTGPKKPMVAKQKLLHLLSTEISINTRVHGEITCFRSGFEQWNTLLPHNTVLIVLQYLGVSEKWLSFFQNFLQAPLRFMDETSAPRTRRRGTPGSHSLSEFFSEAVLFCLDFTVNQKANGALLYRLYDDFWFWSPKQSTCVESWNAVCTFNKVMGVAISELKSGAARIGRDKNTQLSIDASLPKGQIKWGFLYLDPRSGRFEIDQSILARHVEELKQQLQDKTMSIFSWIQIWNTYATTFLTTNFGTAANSFGKEHVDKMLATHEWIHQQIFGPRGSVVDYLKSVLKQRFGVENIPDGFLFFPVELGGLNLKSPFIQPLQIRDSVLESPDKLLDEFELAEKEYYRSAKARFESGETRKNRYELEDPDWAPSKGKDVFMSFEEFTRYREEFWNNFSGELSTVFDKLLQRPREQSIEATAMILEGLNELDLDDYRFISYPWSSMTSYWKWIAQLYGPEMIDRFGGLRVVERELLPIGMISVFTDKRVNWNG